MKHFVLSSLLLLLALKGNTQTWAWARNTTGSSTGVVNGLCTDGSGNIFEAGYFYGSTINFGGAVLTKQGPAGSGSACFLVKYDAAGNLLWAKAFGGTSNFDMIRSACTDAQGHVFVTGSLGSAQVAIGSLTLTGSGNAGSIFIAKFDVAGNVLWANRYNGSNMDEGTGICTDAQGNVCISAYYSSSTLAIGSTTLTCNAARSALIAKFDGSGSLLWASQPAGSVSDAAYAITSDAGGNFFLAGHFNSSSLSFGAFALTKSGFQDAFLAKYDGNGTALWARSTTGNNMEHFGSVAVDGAGNAYVLGHYTSTVVTLGTLTLAAQAQEDVMLAKYSAGGNALWARSVTGSGRDIGHMVHVSDASVFFTGSMGSLGYAPGAAVTIGTLTLNPPPGYTDPMFLAQLDINGNLQYATALGSGGYNRSAVCTDKACHAYLGSNYANANSVPMTIGSNTLAYTIYENVFLARLDFICLSVGLAGRSEEESGYLLYPNPNNGSFMMELPSGGYELNIYSGLGQLVYHQALPEGKTQVQAGTLAPGVYHYQVLNRTGSVKAGKLVLQ